MHFNGGSNSLYGMVITMFKVKILEDLQALSLVSSS